MPEPPDRHLVRMARRAENDHVALQAGWPSAVRIIAAPFDHEPAMLPFVFAAAFAAIADERMRRLALASRLFADAPRLDREGALAARFELHALLPALFPDAEPVWKLLRELESRRVWAAHEADLYRRGRRALAELDADTAAVYARAADVVPRFVLGGLALLAADGAPLDALTAAAGDVAEAAQLLRDVRSWRADLGGRRATFATSRLARAFPDELHDAARPFYVGGIAGELVDRARALLERATETLAAQGGVRWRRAIALLEQAAEVRAALDQVLTATVSQQHDLGDDGFEPPTFSV